MSMISDSSLSSEGRKRLAELKRHFAELVDAYKKNPDSFAEPAVTGRDDDSDDDRDGADLNWKQAFTLVEGDLADILGGGPSPGGASPAANSPAIAVNTAPRDNGVVGTTGQLPPAAASPSGSPATPQSVPSADSGTTGTNVAGTPASTTSAAGGAGAAPSTSTISGGLVAGAIGLKNLEPEVRQRLEQVRLHVEMFFAATTMNLEGETAP